MRATRAAVVWLTATLFISVVMTAAGCTSPSERLNAPPQGQTDHPAALQDSFVRMNDNALLAERSMSPAHFVPGTNELNTIGVRRLMRYATLLKVYGGSLAYDGVQDPKAISEKRVDQIASFLAAAGVGPDNVKVELALAGGRQQAIEASQARDASRIVSDKGRTWTYQEAQKRVLDASTETTSK